MPNNLYNQLNNSQSQNFENNFSNLQNMVNEFNNFKNSFQGDPKQMVQQLLQNGKMSQSQYNQLSQMALQFKNLLQKG